MASNIFAYEPPRYDLLPKGYELLEIEKYLFRFVLWLVGLAVDLKDGLRKPTLGKLAFYFVVRYLFNLIYHFMDHFMDHLIESFFDWWTRGSPTW